MISPVTNFYYSKRLPDNAVGIAKVVAKPIVPADYVDTFNQMPAAGQIGPGDLGAKAWPVEANVFPAKGLLKPLPVNDDIPVTGESYEFKVENQFVEVTTEWDSKGTYFYYHELPAGTTNVTILDADKKPVEATVKISAGRLYHSLDGKIYWLKYFTENRFHEDLILYNPVMKRGATKRGTAPCVQEGFYGWTHGVIDLPTREEHRIRFLEDNRYRILPPYTGLANDPWYPRVRFNVKPMPREWARMNFSPFRPYMVGTWVPGKLVAPGLIEFERTRIFFDGSKYPHILVFDKDFSIKLALDGNPVSSPDTNGYLYPWEKARFVSCDARNARVQINAEIAEDDVIYGFYFYEEQDLIYTALDINPFTNPDVRNRRIELVYRESSTAPERSIWHRVYDGAGNIIAGLSLEPEDGTAYVIGSIVVGGSVSVNDFTVEDVRVRGGGLKAGHENVPEARNFWDVGYWDGKPYPVKGGLVVYLPAELKARFPEDFIRSAVQATAPMGTIPVIRFYTQDGEES
jgi:hypothetical protein